MSANLDRRRPSTARHHDVYYEKIEIYGTGFAIDGTELTLEPTSEQPTASSACTRTQVGRLREGKIGAALGSAESMPLVVTKIDTAAGEYIFQDGRASVARPSCRWPAPRTAAPRPRAATSCAATPRACGPTTASATTARRARGPSDPPRRREVGGQTTEG